MRFIRHLRRLQRAGGQRAEYLMSAPGQIQTCGDLGSNVRFDMKSRSRYGQPIPKRRVLRSPGNGGRWIAVAYALSPRREAGVVAGFGLTEDGAGVVHIPGLFG